MKRHEERFHDGQGRKRLRSAQERERRAPSGACLSLRRSTPAWPDQLASLEVMPELDNNINIEINPADIRCRSTAPPAQAASTSTRPLLLSV